MDVKDIKLKSREMRYEGKLNVERIVVDVASGHATREITAPSAWPGARAPATLATAC